MCKKNLFLFVAVLTGMAHLIGCGGEGGPDWVRCVNGTLWPASGALPADCTREPIPDAGPSVDSGRSDLGQPDSGTDAVADTGPSPDSGPGDGGSDTTPPADGGTGDTVPPTPDAGTPDVLGCTPGVARVCGTDVGECVAGTQICLTGGVWSACFSSVGPTATESCNSRDDDCDGVTDEGLGSSSCGVGACQRTVQNCASGVAQTCTPGTPTAAEVCGNGLDDDCDGATDEGCAVPLAPARVTWAAPAGWVVDDIRHNITVRWVELPVGGVASYYADFPVVLGRPYLVNGRLRNTTTDEVRYFVEYLTGFSLTPPCVGVAPTTFGTITFAIGARVVACPLGGAACVANATCTP
ncbi:MAG: BNR repeat domain protein [Parcubacteria group bacterium GW2011_GWC2_45_7]|nr:MAG: BNR repeat domain protein [Parcubacteria group bacterium GW2011_GWC2_45_7]KKU73669.1 MAG: BNR repeat domain protein [Parcubacteria group bacterium GW2011_GWA2_47_26]